MKICEKNRKKMNKRITFSKQEKSEEYQKQGGTEKGRTQNVHFQFFQQASHQFEKNSKNSKITRNSEKSIKSPETKKNQKIIKNTGK